MRVHYRLSAGFALFMGALAIGALLISLVPPAFATTLEQLTLKEMAQKSTAIVRARVTGSRAATRNGNVYTYFQLQVLENWKGQTVTEVALPGGAADGIRQIATGAPELKPGREYVLFLWTSRSGLTQLIGLSQGLFKLSEEGSEGGKGTVAQRPAASELMVDRSGRPVEDRPLSMPLTDLRAHVRQALYTRKPGAAK